MTNNRFGFCKDAAGWNNGSSPSVFKDGNRILRLLSPN